MEQQINVRAIRDTLGLTQTALADKVGVAQGDISNWENGKHAPSKAARRSLQRLLDEHNAQQQSAAGEAA